MTEHAPDPMELYQLRVDGRCTTEEDPAHPIVARMYYLYNPIARTAVNILDQLQMGHSPGYKAMMLESYMDRTNRSLIQRDQDYKKYTVF
jgi:hypothetical protein